MKTKLPVLAALGASVTSILAAGVSAATMSFWDSMLKPFANMDVAYKLYSPFINMIIYLVIFIGLANWTLGKRFEKGGKAVTVGIGIIFSVALSLWEKNAEINIITAMGPIAMLVFVGIMGLAVYEGLTHSEFFQHRKSAALAISYFFFFTAIIAIGIAGTIGAKIPWVLGILTILYIICVIWGGITVLRLFGGKKNVHAAVKGEVTPEEQSAHKRAEIEARDKADVGKAEDEIKLEMEEAAFVKQAYELLEKMKEKVGGLPPEADEDAKKDALQSEMEDAEKALADIQEVAALARKAIKLADKMEDNLEKLDREAAEDEKEALEKANEMRKIAKQAARDAKTVKKNVGSGKVTVDEIESLETLLKGLYGDIDKIINAEKKVIHDLKEQEAREASA